MRMDNKEKLHMVKVKDVALQIRGVTFAKSDVLNHAEDGYMPVLRAGNIKDVTAAVSWKDIVYIPLKKVKKVQLLNDNDVIISASSGSLDAIGKSAQFKSDSALCGIATFGAFLKVLRPNSVVDPRYFAYYFRTKEYRAIVSHLAAGININNLRNQDLDNLELYLPSLEEQRRIVAVLDRADAIRAKRRQILADLDELETNLFLEFFGKCENLIELGALIIEGPANGLYRPQSDYGSGTCILRIDGFYDGKVLLDRLKRVSIPESEMRRYGLLKGDIVINRVNSLQYLGKSALIPDLCEPVVYESNMMRFRVDENLVLPLYVVAWLQTRNATDQIARCAKRAVNQASINQKDVKSLRVPLPPIELQKEFARRVEAITAARAKVERALALDDELFAALQSRAFRGAL